MSLQFWFQVTEDWRILPQSGLLTRSSSRGCGSLCTPFFSWERWHPPLPRGQQRWWCFVPLSLLASADRVSSLLKCSLSPSAVLPCCIHNPFPGKPVPGSGRQGGNGNSSSGSVSLSLLVSRVSVLFALLVTSLLQCSLSQSPQFSCSRAKCPFPARRHPPASSTC